MSHQEMKEVLGLIGIGVFAGVFFVVLVATIVLGAKLLVEKFYP